MDPKTIDNLKLLYLMDDSLSIDIADLFKFLQYLGYFPLKKQDIIKIVSDSNLYYYDESSSKIKLKKKCERRIIVFPSFPLKDENNYESEVRQLFKCINCDDKIDRMDKLKSGIIFVYFENEEETSYVYRKFESYKIENVILILTQNLDLNANIKSENLKRKLLEKLEKPIEEIPSNIVKNESYYIEDLKNKVLDIKEYNKKKNNSYYETQPMTNKNYYSQSYQDKNKKNSSLTNDKKNQIMTNKFDIPSEDTKTSEPISNTNQEEIQEKENRKKSWNEDSFRIPLNKDYKINLEIEDSNSKKAEITEKYQYLDFAKIFFNLTLLFKTDKPKDFEHKFIPEIMRELPRKELDVYKKNEGGRRERAQTFYETRRGIYIM